jgi:ABC-type polysaccharide/polyol phosphate transport system ATPase subunit
VGYAIRFENVTKRYPRGGPRYASLRHDFAEGVRRAGRRLVGQRNEGRGPIALEDLSFEIEEGESYAIVGPNGAGKTTALKLISRISYPTSGRVKVRGRVGALIEVGSGVHPELNARENIWLYGQIMGMSKADVKRRFDEIVEFAELGHALDRPVKMYSTGMQLRLGFAVASHLDPDIFVVDEALAVGDAGFQAKCVERMMKLVAEGRTLLFVSHNLSAVEAVCERGLFLLDGRMYGIDETSQLLRSYLQWTDEHQLKRLENDEAPARSRFLELEKATCHDSQGAERYAYSTGDDLEIRLQLRAPQPLSYPHVSIGISDGRPGNLALCSMLVDGGAPEILEGRAVVSCKLRSIPLLPRVYHLWASVRSEHAYGDVFDWQSVGSFRIADAPGLVGPAAQAHASTDGAVYIEHDWEVN